MSLPWVISLLILVITGLYALLILYNTCWRLPGNRPGPERPNKQAENSDLKLSVLIPYRNEAESLPALLAALLDQSLDAAQYEVLFIDDHSADGSRKILENALGPINDKDQGNHIFSLALQGEQQGKKAALALGMSRAAFATILQMDADCLPGKDYLLSHYKVFQKENPNLLAGAVDIEAGRGFLRNFERLDQMALTGVSAGSFARGRALMCSGANLLYTKELYRETRSFDPGLASGDDMFLMMGARKLGKRLVYNTDPRSVLRTRPAESLIGLLRQRVRWGSKTGAYPVRQIQVFALLVMLSSLALISLPAVYLTGGSVAFLLASLLLKVLADLAVLERTSKLTGGRGVLWYFPLAVLLHPPYLLLSALGAMVGPGRWKGR